jgi:gamma-glutamyltranspeptidase/glutathione hydrolase
MLVRDSNGSYKAVVFREFAPAAAFEDMYEGRYEASFASSLERCVNWQLLDEICAH